MRDRQVLVFDIGANVGDKSYIFCKMSRLVVAVEPDRNNGEILFRRFKFRSNVRVVKAAVGRHNGVEPFHITSPGSPANTLSPKWKSILENPEKNRWSKSMDFKQVYEVDVVTVDSLIEQYGFPYFIKVDVEGYEIQVLEGLSKSIPVISIEANFPEFLPETLSCLAHLRKIANHVRFNIVNDGFRFFWKENKSYEFTVDWINKTDIKYFEIFCFSE